MDKFEMYFDRWANLEYMYMIKGSMTGWINLKLAWMDR